jgi:hypothetical protein
VFLLMMPEGILDHGDRDLSMTVAALGSDEPVPKFYAACAAVGTGSLET